MTQSVLGEMNRRILVIDGAMGTQLQERDLTAEDFGGAAFEGCNEMLVLTRPDVVEEIHLGYLEAGADIVETDSFGATGIVLADYGLAERAFEINRCAALIARKACDACATPERPRFVAGSMGPTTKSISVTGGVTFSALSDAFQRQALGLLAGGADLLLLETAQDTMNLKAAADGIARAFATSGRRVPLMISGTIEPTGSMLAGQGVEALYASVAHLEDHLGLISIGLNCATGPEFMTDHLRSLAALATCAVSVYPNAGLPDENGHYAETPASLAGKLARFVDAGWINLVGGCCGTTPSHIASIAQMVKGKAPRVPASTRRRMVAGIEPLFVEDETRPVLVGERTNVIGSRRFKNLIVAESFEEGSEIARSQVKGGAQVIDVCVANPDRDEAQDMERILDFLPNKVKAPIMIDSTDAAVMELALRRLQGKCLLNSINLEDGEGRFEQVTELLKRFGGAVVVGCIDDDPQHGMALSAARKLAVARRSFGLLTGKYGVRPEDIVFDPLVFPVGSGDLNYLGSAQQTIEGVRLITGAFPRCATILGISNVSFGLPLAGREVLNAVFLYHCVKAGLSYAIVNTEKLERYASIPEAERTLCEDLIFWRGEDPVAAFAAAFRDRPPFVHTPAADLPLDERLPRYIVEGAKAGLTEDLDLALGRGDRPLDIINGALMAGMAEVGRLFNDNQLIVAEVLQSAEAMKAAVAHLQPFMEKSESHSKGKLLLATVKGDVHDIGKNLVEIILSNNGFEVVNLGIKVPPEVLIEACRREKPDFIGLSGLLVKSAQQMAVSAADLRAAGIGLPLLVGGAALSKKFADTRIAGEYGGTVLYAKDAMNGLELVNQLADPTLREGLLEETAQRQALAAMGAPPPRRRAAGPRVDATLRGEPGRADPCPARLRAPHPEGHPDIPGAALPEPPDALQQAPGAHGGAREAPRRGRREGRQAARPGEPDAGAHRVRRRHPSPGPVPLLPGGGPRERPDPFRPARHGLGDHALFLPAPGSGRAPLPRRFRPAAGPGLPGQRRPLGGHLRYRGAAGGRAPEAGRGVPGVPSAAGPGARAGRGDRGIPAPAHPRRLGDRGPPLAHHGGDPQGGLPGGAGLLRLSGLPGTLGPAEALRPAGPLPDRGATHRGVHDGPRGERLGAGLSPSRGALFQRGPVKRPPGRTRRSGGAGPKGRESPISPLSVCLSRKSVIMGAVRVAD